MACWFVPDVPCEMNNRIRDIRSIQSTGTSMVAWLGGSTGTVQWCVTQRQIHSPRERSIGGREGMNTEMILPSTNQTVKYSQIYMRNLSSYLTAMVSSVQPLLSYRAAEDGLNSVICEQVHAPSKDRVRTCSYVDICTLYNTPYVMMYPWAWLMPIIHPTG